MQSVGNALPPVFMIESYVRSLVKLLLPAAAAVVDGGDGVGGASHVQIACDYMLLTQISPNNDY